MSPKSGESDAPRAVAGEPTPFRVVGERHPAAAGDVTEIQVVHDDFPQWTLSFRVSTSKRIVGFSIDSTAERPSGSARLNASMSGTRPAWGAADDGPEVTARLLRRLPVGEASVFVRQRVAVWVERSLRLAEGMHQFADRTNVERGDLAGQWARDFDSDRRPGRRGRDDRSYAAVAALYVQALAAGRGVESVAEELGYSASRVRNILYEARSSRRRLLTKAPPGKSGGELTERARTLLAQDEED